MAEETIWNAFLAKRRSSARTFIHRSLLRTLVGWILYVFITVYPLTQDDLTRKLVPYVIALQLAQTVLLVVAIFATVCPKWEDNYTRIVTVALSVLLLLNFSRGIVVDVLVRVNDLYSEGDSGSTAATAIASRVFGSHEVLFAITAFSTMRIIVLDKKYLCFLFLGIPTGMIILALLQSAIDRRMSFRGVSSENVIFNLLLVLLSISANALAAMMRTENEWHYFVARKRLQLECIRTEELLKLSMPREIAHQQMMGKLLPVRYTCVSIGFIYLANYAEFVRDAGTDVMHFMETMHRLLSKLDEMILLQKEVYKIESVANCYMVSCGAPHKCRNHAMKLLHFLLRLMEEYDSQKLSYLYDNNGVTTSKPLHLKIGLHCGPVTSGVIGKSRTFFRFFGDTVNVAARIASVAEDGQIVSTAEFHEKVSREMRSSKSDEIEHIALSHEARYEGKVHLKGKGEKCYFSFHVPPSNSDDKVTGTDDVKESEHLTVLPTLNSESSMHTKSLISPVLIPLQGLQILRVPQKRIAAASKMLRISATEAPTEYKGMCQTKLSIHSSHYVSQIERLGILNFAATLRSQKKAKRYDNAADRFASSVVSVKHPPIPVHGYSLSQCMPEEVGQKDYCNSLLVPVQNHERTSPSSPFGDDDNVEESSHYLVTLDGVSKSDAVEAAEDSHISSTMDCLFFPVAASSRSRNRCINDCGRHIHLLQANFADEALEDSYQRRMEASCYYMTDYISGFTVSTLVIFIAFYYRLIAGEMELLVTLSIVLVCVLLVGNTMFKKFRELYLGGNLLAKLFDWDSQIFQLDAEALAAANERGVTERVPDCATDPNVANLRIQSRLAVLTRKLKRIWVENASAFSSWLAGVIWILCLVFFTLDQLFLRQSEFSTQEACLKSFLLPTSSVLVVQLCCVITRVQLVIQVGVILLHIFALLVFGMFSDCDGAILVLGFLFLLTVAINGITESGENEIRARRSLVAHLVSKRANRQASGAADRLFPSYITEKLKKDERIPFEGFHDDVVILWADLVGFTSLSSQLDSYDVMRMLDEIYCKFDEDVEKKHMWKMETIGDAYIVIGGLVDDSEVNISVLAGRLFSLAMSMLSRVRNFNERNHTDISLRIGIHAGQVGSGIAGKLRPRYYVFGENVLYAEHMESTGKPGLVHVSKYVAKLYDKSRFSLQPLGGEAGEDTDSFWLVSATSPYAICL